MITRAPSSFGLATLALLTGLVLPPLAVGGEEDQGAKILRSVDAGQRSCGQLTNGDFEHVGEYVMGRMVGSTGGHESMDALMRSMMGAGAAGRMHTFMGRRFSGCGGARVPAGFGGMMGVMGMMGAPFGRPGTGGALGPGSMMGQDRGPDGSYGLGTMMDGARSVGDDDDMPAGMWVVMLAVLVLVSLTVIWAIRSWRPGPGRQERTALEILQHRYASGEIDAEEFRRRSNLLGGSR